MPERIRKKQSTDQSGADDTDQAVSADQSQASRLREDLDSLLDEIDDVLEENAEEFVRNYVQKGGE